MLRNFVVSEHFLERRIEKTSCLLVVLDCFSGVPQTVS